MFDAATLREFETFLRTAGIEDNLIVKENAEYPSNSNFPQHKLADQQNHAPRPLLYPSKG
jgi:hypothetical protein